jgi:nucleotide-binding universal stress UspA family protein
MNLLVNADDESVELGILFARAFRANVTVLQLGEIPVSGGNGETAVLQFREAGILVDLIQREGDWLPTLLTVTRAYRFDLAVIPKMRRRGVTGLLLGSIPRSLLSDLRGDLLIALHPRPGIARLLIAVAAGPGQKQVLLWGGQAARAFNAEPVLFHVTGRVPGMFDGLASVDEPLSRFMRSNTVEARAFQNAAESLHSLQLEPELKLAHGSVGDELVAEARAGNYDLIVLGSTYAGSRSVRWLMQRVTESVVKRAPCPVLVVRRGEVSEF